jgi:SIR2-like domain
VLRTTFGQAQRPSLIHWLLGSLPIREAATTNYDRLFETAWRAASDEPVITLPRDDGPATQWLLKLHGDVDDAASPLVLSREEYLRFEQTSGALVGVMHAILLTRHLLVVGYGLTDETFHRIAHDVREVRRSGIEGTVAQAASGQRLGTALLVTPADLAQEIWSEDLHLVELARPGEAFPDAARHQEILLDCLAQLAAPVEAYVLGAGWQELTTGTRQAAARDAGAARLDPRAGRPAPTVRGRSPRAIRSTPPDPERTRQSTLAAGLADGSCRRAGGRPKRATATSGLPGSRQPSASP